MHAKARFECLCRRQPLAAPHLPLAIVSGRKASSRNRADFCCCSRVRSNLSSVFAFVFCPRIPHGDSIRNKVRVSHLAQARNQARSAARKRLLRQPRIFPLPQVHSRTIQLNTRMYNLLSSPQPSPLPTSPPSPPPPLLLPPPHTLRIFSG